MDCLRDHLVGSDEKNKKLRITVDEIRMRQAPYRDLPNRSDGPLSSSAGRIPPGFCSRLRLVKIPHGRSAHTLNLSENCLDLHVDQLASPPVGDSKLERGLVTMRRDDGIAAVK